MKYYILEGTVVKALPEAEMQEALAGHLAYLSAGVADGTILVSGPKITGGGGFMVMKTDDVDAFCANDPFVKAGVQEYSIKEFHPEFQGDSKTWF